MAENKQNEIVKLDLKDKKIIALLDENARYSNSQIAKKVGLSKPAVEYRIQRMQKNNVVFEHYAVIDFTKFGYSQYKIYFKFQNASLEDEEKITSYWNKARNTVWVAQIRSRWDLAVSVLARTNFEFGEILSGFMDKFSKFILEKDILLTEYSPVYSKEYLAQSNRKTSEFTYGNPAEKLYELDETDEKILRTISIDSRINIVDLAEKINLSRDIINYRLKKLLKEKVIVQFRTYLNLQNIGINHYKVILRTKNFNEKSEKELKSYITSHKKATQFLKLIGSWDIEIEFETENEDELYKILNELRKQFSDIIRDYDILRITKTFRYDYFPF